MKIRDVMSGTVAKVKLACSVVEAAQMMQKHDVGSLPVCEGDKLLGIVTDRDIVVRNVAHGKSAKDTTVRDVMTSQVKTISADTGVQEAAEMMADSQVRRLPVVDAERLVGMISLGDLATKANYNYNMEVGEILENISEPSEPENMK